MDGLMILVALVILFPGHVRWERNGLTLKPWWLMLLNNRKKSPASASLVEQRNDGEEAKEKIAPEDAPY